MASPLGRPSPRGRRWTETAWEPRWTRKLASASSDRSQGRPDSRETSVQWVGGKNGRRPGR
eukprot:8180073-Alexandrium_andersonii.AAC.1